MFEKDDCICCEIQDEGEGPPAENQQKLFGEFARLGAKPTVDEHSAGLGLSIVKKLTEAINGQVWTESAGRGQGATFIVELFKAAIEDVKKNI